MRIGKPRRRRVWDNPPETRRAWRRSKRADLEPGRFTRHSSGREQRKRARRANILAARRNPPKDAA